MISKRKRESRAPRENHTKDAKLDRVKKKLGKRRTVKIMSFNVRKEVPMKHLFDGIDLNVYEKSVINLSAGTPSLELLKDCTEIFAQGTSHRMVMNQSFMTLTYVLLSD
jgi:hypothetical protein